MRRLATLPLLTLALLLLPACRSVTPKPPSVSLVNIEPGQVTPFETTARFQVRVINRDRIPLTVTGSSHTLLIDGVRVGEAVSPDAVTIDPLTSGLVTGEVYISHLRLVSELLPILRERTFDYALASEFYLGEGLFAPTLETSREGRFTLSDQSARQFAAIRPTTITPTPVIEGKVE